MVLANLTLKLLDELSPSICTDNHTLSIKTVSTIRVLTEMRIWYELNSVALAEHLPLIFSNDLR